MIHGEYHFSSDSRPEPLSPDITTKRNHHKITEQSRRNRFNAALQGLASLLPPSTPQLNGQGRLSAQTNLDVTTSGKTEQHNNSKANTIESALEYIKTLQQEIEDVRAKLEAAEKQKEVNTDTDAVQCDDSSCSMESYSAIDNSWADTLLTS